MTSCEDAQNGENGLHRTLSDTPPRSESSTAPGSPRIPPIRQNSGSATPRVRPPATTLNIPGMTRSRVSPDGKISQRDVGAKLVVIMVGLPARGKSYITKKISRYLSWQQHDARIFNVGNRRRVAAGSGGTVSPPKSPQRSPRSLNVVRTASIAGIIDAPTQAAHILLNGVDPIEEQNELAKLPSADTMEQSAQFFDPKNKAASKIREQVALSTCDELLDFLLNQGGSVGILDATNSTVERRQILFEHIKSREPKLGILFIESICEDEKLLEANMHLKLRGPDYKDKDPESSLADFRQRVKAYESAYVPLGKFEENNGMQYIKMIDVGKKVVHYRLQGFLAGGIASYLSTFNLSPRQIWITRHGQSMDNTLGKIGGDSDLTEAGKHYATTLYNFISKKRLEWETDQKQRALEGHTLPLMPGDKTPPYPELLGELEEKNFCVWTSMLKRSVQTAEGFQDDDDYDVKNWEMLNELDAGDFEGLTYAEIETRFPEQYAKRKADKLSYIYPGVGGEGYLQVISRLRDMVRELERIKDHVLVIAHRSVCRVLMAYFMDLTRDDIADLDVPLGMLYAIEPKPYGIDFHAYRYNEGRDDVWTFEEVPNYKPAKATSHTA
ncbi:putative 6-phosphofructo-2-kinase PB17E12.14c [Acephala macrosclerotiorum]|nr:putative 6-phosphofructo-2-kinase PB17E12.14c [Acephala macrosclerotiorum]